jgi:hypothetical protein
MATSGLYGSSPTGAVVSAPGSESAGLYGNGTTFGGSYFEWFIFYQSETQPATPTGGSWSFQTNSGTPPTGWSATPPAAPTLPVWVSIALVNSRDAGALVWSAPGVFSYASGLPILSGSGSPNSGDGLNNQLWIQTGTTPQTIWFKESGTWVRLTGSTLYVDTTSTQTVGGTKTFSSVIQGSVSGTSNNVTGIVSITNGGTGATSASAARTALGAAASGANSDITSLTGLTTPLSLAQGGTASTTANGAFNTLAPSQTGNSGKYLTTDGSNTSWAVNPLGTVTSVAVSGGSTGLTTSGGPITTSGTITLAGTLAVANGGTGVTTSSGANSVVLRDANGNITTNCLFEGYVTQAASGTAIVLIASSAQNYQITGTGGQTIRLPDATTLPSGATFTFNNNQSSGAITVQNNSSTTVATIQSGGYVTIVLSSNSTAAGSWDRHDSTPANVSWSTNTLDYPGSITSATWNGATVAINRGGTGQTTAQAAMNSFAGAVTSGSYLRGNGTNVVMSTIQAADVPTLNQNTTGTAANVTGIVAIANGGTGTTTPSLVAGTNVTITGSWPNQTINSSNTGGTVTSVAATVPTFLSVTGSPITTSGTLAISLSGTALPVANGGTGLTTTPANGALDIGNGTGFTRTTLTAGTGISITNASGSITIATTSGGGTVTSVAATVPSFLSISGSPITTTGTLAIGLSGTALPTANGGTGLTSFTSGGVVYASSSSALATGSALVFDGTNLGVANSSPSDAVTVGTTTTGKNIRIYSSSNGNNGLFRMFDSGGTERLQLGVNTTGEAVYYSPTSSVHAWYINTEQMRLTSTGLGIGTSSPSTKLDVNGDARIGGTSVSQSLLTIGGGSTSAAMNLRGSTGSAYAWQISSNAFVGSALEFTRSTAVGGTTFSTPSMLLDSSGNLGLGVTPSGWASGAKAFQVGSSGAIWERASDNLLVLASNTYFDGGADRYIKTGYASRMYQLSGAFYWETAVSGTAGASAPLSSTMTLTSAKRLGIGTTSPNTKLHVLDPNGNNGHNGDNSGLVLVESTYASTGASSNSSLVTKNYYGYSQFMQWENYGLRLGVRGVANGGAGALVFTSGSDSEGMRLDSSGNLLVGTTSAYGKLTVTGAVASSGLEAWIQNTTDTGGDNTRYAGLSFSVGSDNGTSAIRVYRTNSGADYSTNMTFWTKGAGAGATSPTERMRITSSGNLIVGTTSSSFNERIASINSSSYTYGSYRSGTGSEGHIIFVNGNGAVGSIFTNGSVTLFNTTSDQRLKENIQDADSSSSLIDALQVRKFDWKANGSHQRYGFVAQELLTVAPEAVNQPEDTEQMMAVDYSKLVPMLVKEIQSLRKRLADAGIA